MMTTIGSTSVGRIFKNIPRCPADDPLVIRVHRSSSGGWTIEAANSALMTQRLQSMDDLKTTSLDAHIKQEWALRNGQGQPPALNLQNSPSPIIMMQGDLIRFECPPLPVLVWAEKDPRVDPLRNAPDSPFGPPQTVGDIMLMPVIDTDPGPATQGFYKFKVEVSEGGMLVEVGPDGFCAY